MSQGATRREALKWSLGGYALARLLLSREALAGPVRKEVQAWAVRTHELCNEAQGGKLAPAEWQRQVEALYSRVSLLELLAAIDFDRLAAAMKLPDDRAEAVQVPFPQVEGLPRVFATKLFGMSQGRAIVPHGHQNMASMHLVLRPTIDRASKPGDLSSISDERDNVHWLVATKGPAYTFDVIISGLNPERGFNWKMDHVDVDGAERLKGGLLRARRIGFDEAIRRYGKT